MSGVNLRLFVAVSVPAALLEKLAQVGRELGTGLPGGRWTPVENQHVTLKFLGSTPGELLEEVASAVGTVAARHPPAALRLTELGSFPSRRRARVLWAGLGDGAGLLGSLAAGLDEVLAPLGFAAETRAFTPHLTLARWRTPVPLRTPLPALPPEATQEFIVADVKLFRSHLSPRGARYEALQGFSLAGEAE